MNILQAKEGQNNTSMKIPSEVDKYIKVKVVGDAIKLMRMKIYKEDRGQITKFGCMRRILPSGEEEDYQTFSKAKYLYEKLLNRKGAHMTLTAFGKLSKIKLLKPKVNRVSLDLLYKRIV